MKKLINALMIIAVSLIFAFRLQAQDTVNVFYRGELIRKVALKGDTAFWYNVNPLKLECIVFDKDKSSWQFESWVIEDGIRKSLFKYELKKGLVWDGVCHGIKSDGNRCTRTVKAGIFYCWQHD